MTNRLSEETIVALSTPPGRGAISVVRMSGARALAIVRSAFRARSGQEVAPLCPLVGHIYNGHEQPLDEVVVTFYQAPRSFTGEDVVEISCHGSPVIVRGIVERLAAGGARLAEPGEFSLRAFFHGKMDLTQAEAIRDMIEAQTRMQAELARRQLDGSLSTRLAPLQQRLVDMIVQLETAVEFVEDPVSPRGRGRIGEEIGELEGELARLVESFARGRLLREGWMVALAGRPNVGKSSLFNRLLGQDRAIVTEVAGTTRDTISEAIDLEGMPVTFVDTAGMRRGRGRVEQEGVRRSSSAVADAHLVLLVLDAAQGWTPGDSAIWSQLAGKKVVAVWNKMDLLPDGSPFPTASRLSCAVMGVSARTGRGVEEMKTRVAAEGLPPAGSDEDLVITSLRHRDCLERSRQAIGAAGAALSGGLSEEFAVADLRRGLDALGEITGETLVEDILQQIFSQFCIGK